MEARHSSSSLNNSYQPVNPKGTSTMRPSLALALAVAAVGSISWASINLNSSRSNIYRLVYSPDVMSQAQATAVLAEMDKIGPANEATVRSWLSKNLKRHGVHTDRIKEIRFVPASSARKVLTIAFLTNSPDEPAALAATCPECVPVRHPPSKPNL
jgi:hypothetical protein